MEMKKIILSMREEMQIVYIDNFDKKMKHFEKQMQQTKNVWELMNKKP